MSEKAGALELEVASELMNRVEVAVAANWVAD